MTIGQDGSEALDDLFWRAEILQALYWMRGENLGAEVEPAALAEFLMAEPSVVDRAMQRLADEGYLEAAIGSATVADVPDGSIRYSLTPLGIEEGGRSFRDEFDDLLRPGHFQCSSDCSCLDPDHAGEPCPVHSH